MIAHRLISVAGTAVSLLSLLLIAGCQTPQFADPPVVQQIKPDAIVLREGDIVRITFPGAPNLNAAQTIRRDGKIALQLVGEVQAAGLSPGTLEKELIKLYAPQLQTKEVNVTLESSAFPLYVTGAVLHPGKITSDRPLTALEAIMEAGGFDYAKANLKAVRVIRHEKGRTEHYVLDLKSVLRGEQNDPFNLKPADIIYVPERFTWF
jgi:polysaccharide export outer membrane protein